MLLFFFSMKLAQFLKAKMSAGHGQLHKHFVNDQRQLKDGVIFATFFTELTGVHWPVPCLRLFPLNPQNVVQLKLVVLH